jgi:large subunit ribosomal protein L3
MKALITKKIGMTTILGDNGESVGVTLLSAAPNVITQIKNQDQDGYSALQIGAGTDTKAGKSKQGHFKASGQMPKIIREIRINEVESENVGDTISADVFSVGDSVDATGITKGKGFAGTIKRQLPARP